MKKMKPCYQIIFFTACVVITVIIILPFWWEKINQSRLEALETVASSIELELEQAVMEHNKQLVEVDNWIFTNSKHLALEPWGETKSARRVYRFLDYLPPETYLGLKSFKPEYLRRYFTVIYEGEGKFRVEIIK